MLPSRFPASALPQFFQDATHAAVAVVVVAATTVLGALGKVPSDVTGAVYTGVVGYVAGRSGSVAGRSVAIRKTDQQEETSHE